ncbi:MucBP domain-containing protein [Levilactobacillus acidifarinae]|nr:MucBP domain-containing protein [Levilactobacillus acidifarinae]GEO70115.1 hypothetical protein LAC03_20250 [Levilactobacillus acidifarinae]
MTTQNWIKLTVLAGIVVGSGGLTTTAQAASDPTPTGTTSLQTTATATVPERSPETQTGTVTVYYLTPTGETLAPKKVLTGPVGDHYQVPLLKRDGYLLVKTSGAAKGDFSTTPVTVKLVYQRQRPAKSTVTPTKSQRAATAEQPRATATKTATPTARQVTPRKVVSTRAAVRDEAPQATKARTTTPAKGVVVLGKYPVHQAATPVKRLPQTGEQPANKLWELTGGCLFLATLTGTYALKRRLSWSD